MSLSVRQEKALEQMKRLPVPPAPEIVRGSLVRPPAGYRWAPVGALLIACSLIGLAFVRLPLSERGSHVVISEGYQTIRIAGGQATLILQSPADFRIHQLQRRLLSGRLEGDLRLGEGELFLQADPRSAKSILLQTPLLTARITGTQLLLGHRPEEGSRLVVLRGDVQVKSAQGWSRLPAGEELTVLPNGLVLRRPMQSAFDPAALAPKASSADPASDPAPAPAPGAPGILRRTIWHEQE